VTYSSYGAGAKPLLLGSLEASDPAAWARAPGTDLWVAEAGAGLDVGNVLWVSGGTVLGYARKR
jgi:hypothetical protein